MTTSHRMGGANPQEGELMPQDGDILEPVMLARRGSDGLAQIGSSRFDIAGIRFVADAEGADGADDGGDEEDQDGQDSSDDEGADDGQDSGDGDDGDGFDGEFDAERAKRLIANLRKERDRAREKARQAKAGAPDAAKLNGENLRLRIALRVGLDEDLADRLRGNTEDELIEDAEKLVGRLNRSEKLEDRTPKPRLRGGSEPDKEPEKSADDIVKEALTW